MESNANKLSIFKDLAIHDKVLSKKHKKRYLTLQEWLIRGTLNSHSSHSFLCVCFLWHHKNTHKIRSWHESTFITRVHQQTSPTEILKYDISHIAGITKTFVCHTYGPGTHPYGWPTTQQIIRKNNTWNIRVRGERRIYFIFPKLILGGIKVNKWFRISLTCELVFMCLICVFVCVYVFGKKTTIKH